jgi:predicted amidohydrolase
MRAACLQLQIESCKSEENLSRALQMAGAALAKGAEILIFPELFLTGFCYELTMQSPSTVQDISPYASLDIFQALAEENDCLIIGSIRRGRLNQGFCLDREGLQLRPKIHPFGRELEHFDGGDNISPVATRWGLAGLEICYDLRFPEVARSLALQGADFLVTVAQFPQLRRDQWRTLAMARAIENQMPHLACNWASGGGSLIIDARGRILAEAGTEEALLWADIDLADRDQFRREVSCFADRRPEVYGRWDTERSNP